ncbi:hypothetical protein RHA1_ro10268 (plasmid) [Rhodococcus jostii RHA1]|uniref:Uncharacterized protein n=1 Tax=Rhodococcus jostii (strain RHA1) TaxID=101510 RepID=Q0RW75_RHOJR|nr:hypothetical protein RHA1_ro10268 [Rhodococcus jostii RHA1]
MCGAVRPDAFIFTGLTAYAGHSGRTGQVLHMVFEAASSCVPESVVSSIVKYSAASAEVLPQQGTQFVGELLAVPRRILAPNVSLLCELRRVAVERSDRPSRRGLPYSSGTDIAMKGPHIAMRETRESSPRSYVPRREGV